MSTQLISSKDISVVVRGLIVDTGNSNSPQNFTKRTIKSIRRFLPEAELIISTWSDQNIEGIDYDRLVINDQPEEIFMTHPGGEVRRITANNQIITSHSGATVATRRYILNIRSDIELQGTGFIKIFEEFNRVNTGLFFQKKIVTLPTYNPRRGQRFLFNVCDWFYFGLTEDIRSLFNIPLMDKGNLKGKLINSFPPVEDNLGAEAYIWTQFLEKNGEETIPNQKFWSKKAFVNSERSYALNTIMAPASVLNITCLKMPRAGYGARPWLSQGLYTFNEYKRLYYKYNDNKKIIIPNFFENTAYIVALTTRRFIHKNAPFLYKNLTNLVRHKHGSYNLLK